MEKKMSNDAKLHDYSTPALAPATAPRQKTIPAAPKVTQAGIYDAPPPQPISARRAAY